MRCEAPAMRKQLSQTAFLKIACILKKSQNLRLPLSASGLMKLGIAGARACADFRFPPTQPDSDPIHH